MLSWNDIKGIGPARRAALEQAGFPLPAMLAELLPLRYQDATRVCPIAELSPGMETALEGVLASPARLVHFRGQNYVSAVLQDSTGSIRCTWFSAPWMRSHLPAKQIIRLYGRIARQKNGSLFAVNPAVVTEPSIQPVYKPIEKLPPKTLRRCMAEVLAASEFEDPLPESFRNRYQLCPRHFALAQAHFPDSHASLSAARRRLAFEELTLFQMHLQSLKMQNAQGVRIASTQEDAAVFWKALPFQPTSAQVRVLEDIRADLASPSPMARLVQGDVGCGKTAVAFGALYLAFRAGYQGALMAPTEVLAAQHYRSAQKLLAPFGIRCLLLTGKLTAAERRAARKACETGDADVIIGTHALISQGVRYKTLGLAITDEQHRFGVRQRSALSEKSCLERAPNVLVLSATPIPRSLSLILFGDLDLSVIDTLPPGRTPVQTNIVPEAKREGMYGFIRAQAAEGRQAYIICPLVEDSEHKDSASAQSMFEQLQHTALASLRLGLVHGKQTTAEKERTLLAFSTGAMDVLVSTTVIEVGVDVPNASIMVIENADQFGLSQLHQLRGRVGRGTAKSYCFFMASSNERLDTLVSTTDGFVIAQKDLDQRGPGEWFGTRQHGAPSMPGAALGADAALLEETQQAVHALLRDPVRTEEAKNLLASAQARFGNALTDIGIH